MDSAAFVAYAERDEPRFVTAPEIAFFFVSAAELRRRARL